jgi:hypothetical protein
MKSLADQLTTFYNSLKPPSNLPKDISVLFPFSDPVVRDIVKKFFSKYYNDNSRRYLILGINPGRFGAGTTGVNFTAPRQLKHDLGIEHPFRDLSELSSEFIYEMIRRYGSPTEFYHHYFIGSISPLGFTRKGVNLNYYDNTALLKSLKPFIVSSIRKLLSFGFYTDKCFCIGGDKNYRYLLQLNEEEGFFKEIIPLPHPRFIMQYRRKQVNNYVDLYLDVLK